jgi:hypothetical protein
VHYYIKNSPLGGWGAKASSNLNKKSTENGDFTELTLFLGESKLEIN